MSMTKRYLESLPADEQDEILGRFDEWGDDAENEPEEYNDITDGRDGEVEREWAQALMEEAEEADRFAERDEAQLVKPQPGRVDCGGWSI